jgi:prepilin-type N-terminal cleavage/methylation domain-containing protein
MLKKAFSLVEISVVILIVSLVVTGVFKGTYKNKDVANKFIDTKVKKFTNKEFEKNVKFEVENNIHVHNLNFKFVVDELKMKQVLLAADFGHPTMMIYYELEKKLN